MVGKLYKKTKKRSLSLFVLFVPYLCLMIKRSITRLEIEETVINGEIIEEYPDDKYSPSCLIYGRTKTERDLYVQLSFPPSIIIITAYDPDQETWIDCKIRR